MNTYTMSRVDNPVYALNAAPRVSAEYAFIPTTEVVNLMDTNGWKLRSEQVQNCRREDKRGFAKHLLRFGNPNLPKIDEFSNVEVIYFGEHWGTAAAKLYEGVFRSVCINGMIAADAMFDSVIVRHRREALDIMLEAVEKIVERAPLLIEKVNEFKGVELSFDEMYEFNRRAIEIRWGEDAPIRPEQMMAAKREDDRGSSLWKALNRAQEYAERGGLMGVSRTGRNMLTRAIRGIDEKVRINREIWGMAESWAHIRDNLPIAA